MPNYRRTRVPGGTFFFTVNLEDRAQRLLVDRIDALREAFRAARATQPFELIAVCVLPDHLHCLWRLPEGDADNARRWAHIKTRFSRLVGAVPLAAGSRGERGETPIWQRRFWERVLTDENDLRTHVDYIHINPLKHRLVERVRDWPHSSFHRYVARGDLAIDWGSVADRAGAVR